MTSDSGKYEEESHLMFRFQDRICLLHMYIEIFFFVSLTSTNGRVASYLEAQTNLRKYNLHDTVHYI